MPCEVLLDLLTTEYVLILIVDVAFIKRVKEKRKCTMTDYPPKMAVPTTASSNRSKLILKYENDVEKNYYLIHDGDYRRAIFK